MNDAPDPLPFAGRALAGLLLAAAVLLHPGAAAASAPPPASVRVLDWRVSAPAAWTIRVPSSEMRLAQFGADTASGKAECVAFHFGLAGGGPVDANIQRWASQFTTDAGAPATPDVAKGAAGGMPVTWVALDGRYARGVGSGPQGAALANQSLRVAIVETPRGNLIFQFWGDRAAVVPQERLFRAMVESLRPAP